MNFDKNTLENAINKLAEGGKIFSNERQFQLELAMQLQRMNFEVEMEVVSSDKGYEAFKTLHKEEREKLYTDIVVKQPNGKYIAIELKYKTPQKHYMYKNNNGNSITFAQGASDLGSVLFWEDIRRIESFADSTIRLNFDDNKIVEKGYAILLTNEKDYWEGKKCSDSLCKEFFPVDKQTKSGDLHWYVKVDKESNKRVSGRTKKEKCNIVQVTEENADEYKDYVNKDKIVTKDVSPIKLKGSYKCVWNKYNVEIFNKEEVPEFRYLLLEVPF